MPRAVKARVASSWGPFCEPVARGPEVGAPGALVCDRQNGPLRPACSCALSLAKHAPHWVRAEGVGLAAGDHSAGRRPALVRTHIHEINQ